ncbi:hypothetical protein EVAR_7483_1 [Eumeta japonica]|uniref:Uncharacterized protein n=1 Tax=Eumeta variegata TaxID=151549 RepID=A0A4C1Y6P0_EUMVA|nr:hypothetical protein EVAR_7483_1 [Eumeta japonica]
MRQSPFNPPQKPQKLLYKMSSTNTDLKWNACSLSISRPRSNINNTVVAIFKNRRVAVEEFRIAYAPICNTYPHRPHSNSRANNKTETERRLGADSLAPAALPPLAGATSGRSSYRRRGSAPAGARDRRVLFVRRRHCPV